MLAAWTEILPLFIVRWLAKRYCERINLRVNDRGDAYVTPRKDVLIKFNGGR